MLPWIFALALVCLILERVIPGWRLPSIKTWPLRVIGVNLIQLVVVFVAGLTWERWLSSASLFHLGAALPAWAGGAVAYFFATFIFYWWHRLRHTSDFLWLHFHQIHHSPRRLEVITSFYKHCFARPASWTSRRPDSRALTSPGAGRRRRARRL